MAAEGKAADAAEAAERVALALPAAEDRHRAKADEELAAAGAALDVTLLLPNGTELKQSFAAGQEVSFVKFTVQEATGIRRADLQLYLDDKVMIDPLSLADFPALGAGKANVITVRSTAEADKDGEAAAGAGHK